MAKNEEPAWNTEMTKKRGLAWNIETARNRETMKWRDGLEYRVLIENQNG